MTFDNEFTDETMTITTQGIYRNRVKNDKKKVFEIPVLFEKKN